MSKLVARTQPGPNMGSPNLTRARKKVAQPSPNRGSSHSPDLHSMVLTIMWVGLDESRLLCHNISIKEAVDGFC